MYGTCSGAVPYRHLLLTAQNPQPMSSCVRNPPRRRAICHRRSRQVVRSPASYVPKSKCQAGALGGKHRPNIRNQWAPSELEVVPQLVTSFTSSSFTFLRLARSARNPAMLTTANPRPRPIKESRKINQRASRGETQCREITIRV